MHVVFVAVLKLCGVTAGKLDCAEVEAGSPQKLFVAS
jgi:hypothetical protein